MTFKPANPTVWIEIPVSDLDAATTYYSAVTGMSFNLQETGPNPIAVFGAAEPMGAVAGHLYPGKPAGDGTGPTVHLAVDVPLDEVRDRVAKAGGTVLSPNIDLPIGAFFYSLDPDGNSIGFFRLN